MSAVLANIGAVAIGGRALLIEGPPGSGKSALALALIDRGAVLIGDDAVGVHAADGQLTVSPPPNIAGLIEVRGVGLVAFPTTVARAALVLRIDAHAARFPLAPETRSYAGVTLPCLPFATGDAIAALRAEHALALHGLPHD